MFVYKIQVRSNKKALLVAHGSVHYSYSVFPNIVGWKTSWYFLKIIFKKKKKDLYHKEDNLQPRMHH